jgi:N-methylhydantoinase B
MIGIFNSIGPGVPPNAGSFRRIEVLLRENCVAGIPVHPTSCSVATTNVADRVANAVQRAFAELGDGIGMAECGGVIPASTAVISGTDPRDGQAFVNQIFLGITGGAGAPTTDAWLTIGHVGNAGMLGIDSVEVDEMRQPFRVQTRRLVPDTEGAGRQRGAPSILVEYAPVGTSITIAYGCDGAENAPLGVRGGLAGGAARHYRREADGALTDLPGMALEVLEPGEAMVSISTGGGGYGPPAERAPELVARDVAEHWVTAERAVAVYGVVLDEGGAVDVEATRQTRSALGS